MPICPLETGSSDHVTVQAIKGRRASRERHQERLEFVKHEFLAVLPPTLYFLLSFNIVVLITSLVLQQYEVHVASHVPATVLVLVIARVVLAADKFELTRRFDGKPLA